jgi:IMP dehydrogenase
MVKMLSSTDKIRYYNGSEALAFPDVYLLPSYSDIKSRFGNQIDIKTQVARGMPKIKIPFLSAGMDTVTEEAMAAMMALNGGLGEIHRNNLPSEQADMVRKVKERMRLIEKNPPIISENATIRDALNLLKRRNRGYVIVFPSDKKSKQFSGIATSRDFLSSNPDTKLKEVMTPLISKGNKSLITAEKGTTLEEAVRIMKINKIEKLPILDKKGLLFGVYTLKDYEHIKKYENAAVDEQGRLMVGAAIGVHEIDVERVYQIVEAGVDVLFLDIAHGHSIYSKEMIKRLKIKEKITIPIVVGNVATKEGVLFAYDIGADGIKVGIGPGFVCKTRNVAGTGIPQITAVLEAKDALSRKKDAPPIIADGGIREPGDAPKAIACGADSVMCGGILAGTDMSPGDIIKTNGNLQKRIRGMASRSVLENRIKMGDSTTNPTLYSPEGREIFTSYQGSTQELLNEFIGGFRSAMSYTGAHSIQELQKAQLIHISSNGSKEQGRAFSE